MKIEPAELYDQEVFSFLKEVKYLLKQSEDNRISYSVRYFPHNKDFYKRQILIDKLAKKGILGVIDCYETQGGTNPDYRGVEFILTINPPFNKIYEKYKRVFSLSRSTKLTIYGKGKATLLANGNSYKAKFQTGSDSFKILTLLAKNKDICLSFSEIGEVLKDKPSKETSQERRVRDAIQYIKTKLEYKKNDFIQTDYGFRLVCDVEIKS